MDEVSAAFQAAGAALAPVYDIEQLMNDPHVQDRDMITTIEDEDLGPLKMQNLIFRMGGTPGAIRHGGRRLGQDTDAVLDELLGISGEKLDELRENGVAVMDRSYLFAPGHNAKLLDRVFHAGADAVMLDLEDAVPPQAKATARAWSPRCCSTIRPGSGSTPPGPPGAKPISPPSRSAPSGSGSPRWNRPPTWNGSPRAHRENRSSAPSRAPAGVLAAQEIAAVPGVRFLAMGGVDLQRDLNTSGGNLQTLYARSHLVLASRAAGIEPPIDSVFPLLDDPPGLRDQAEFARSLGFFGKSAIHPRQLDILHEVFTPTGSEIAWAQRCSPGSRRPAAAASRCPAANSSTCPSPTGPAAAGDRRVSADGVSDSPWRAVPERAPYAADRASNLTVPHPWRRRRATR